jgi:hypothetical protein
MLFPVNQRRSAREYSRGSCPPAVIAADGHGMILIDGRVNLLDATYRVA